MAVLGNARLFTALDSIHNNHRYTGHVRFDTTYAEEWVFAALHAGSDLYLDLPAHPGRGVPLGGLAPPAAGSFDPLFHTLLQPGGLLGWLCLQGHENRSVRS